MSFLQRKPASPQPEGEVKHRYDRPIWRKPEGKPEDEGCALCGAAWTGEWDAGTLTGNELLHRPRYEGGFIWYTPPTFHRAPNLVRYALTYRCRCAVGARRASEIPTAPDWLWRRVLSQPTVPGRLSCHVDDGPTPALLEAADPTTAEEIILTAANARDQAGEWVAPDVGGESGSPPLLAHTSNTQEDL